MADRHPPTVLLSLPSGYNVANVLRGGILQTMLAEMPELRVVVLTSVHGAEATRGEQPDGRVSFEPLVPYQPGRLGRAIDSVVSEKFLRSSQLTAVRLQRNRARLLRAKPTWPVLLWAKDAISGLPMPRQAWYALAQRVEGRGTYAAIFERYAPVLVVTSTAGFALAEMPLIFEAKRRGVPQMAIDLGWDNLSSKYHTILPVDHLVVWNRRMQDEAVRFHGFAPAQVTVSGAPQFDQYFGHRDLPSRTEFMRGIGADPERRLITLATAAAGTYAGTADIVAALAAAVESEALPVPSQVLVRLHPRDVREAYRAVEGLPHVLLDKRVRRADVMAAVSEVDSLPPTAGDRVHLASTLAYSDVLINFASTTTIEAGVFDTPVINIGFDAVESPPLALSIRRYFAYEHYQPVLESGAARVAHNLGELIDQIRRYQLDPSLDREGRARLVREACEFTDGRSAERVGRAVVRVLAARRQHARGAAL